MTISFIGLLIAKYNAADKDNKLENQSIRSITIVCRFLCNFDAMLDY